MSRKMWTDQEIDLLYLWGGERPIDEIASKLKRSHESIQAKAFRLNINLKPEVDSLTALAIAKLLQCDPKALVWWINKGELKANKNDASNKKSHWRIKRRHFKRFHLQHQNIHIFKKAPKENLEWLIS